MSYTAAMPKPRPSVQADKKQLTVNLSRAALEEMEIAAEVVRLPFARFVAVMAESGFFDYYRKSPEYQELYARWLAHKISVHEQMKQALETGGQLDRVQSRVIDAQARARARRIAAGSELPPEYTALGADYAALPSGGDGHRPHDTGQ